LLSHSNGEFLLDYAKLSVEDLLFD